MDANREKIVERIKKLLALSKSPNENEAAVAMEKAQSLLAEYNLTLADVEDAVESGALGEIVMTYTETNSQPWRRPLATAVARLNFSEYIFTTQHKGKTAYDQHVFIGAEHNAVVARHVFEYLIETVDRLARQGALTVPEKQRSPYRVSFRAACVKRLQMRIYERIEAAKEGNVKSESTGTNLPALRSMYDQIEEQLKNAIEQNFGEPKKKVSRLRTDLHVKGEKDGRKAGDEISLEKQIGGASSKQKRIASK